MPRQKTPTPTNNPFGLKLNTYLLDIGRPGDYTFVAEAFGIKRPSVSEWVKFGRIAKRHYALLVEWSGRPLSWWFGTQAYEVSDASNPLSVQEPLARGYVSNPPWPFFGIAPKDYAMLSLDDKRDIEGFIRVALSKTEAARKKLPHESAEIF
jgi:hypothetical protein